MTTVTPQTVGGRFSNALPWTGQPVISTQDGGRRRKGGWAGSGSAVSPGSNADNGSSSGIKGTWGGYGIQLSQGRNDATWSSYHYSDAEPWLYYTVDYVTGAAEPHASGPAFNAGSGAFGAPLYASNETFPGYWSYYDNAFMGLQLGPGLDVAAGPGELDRGDHPAAPGDQPGDGLPYVTDTGSIKTSIANQYNFTPANEGVAPISGFNSITAYRNKLNPGGTGVNYDASWDIYGWAHTAPEQYAISLEVMFWTYWNAPRPRGTSPPPPPRRSMLEFGDGNVWDLYMTPDTARHRGSDGCLFLRDFLPA